jgi:hypothetical protein
MRRVLFIVVTVVLVLGVCLVLAEAALRIVERLPRDRPPDYPDTWREDGLGPGGYLKEGFDAEVVDGYGGTVRWTNNAQGFRYHVDVPVVPEPGVLRVLSMGDSFTAGYRVDQNATFSHLLERRIEREIGPSEVLIACVEDPVAGLFWLERDGQVFRPHVVLLGITLGNDLAQTHVALDPRGPFRLEAGPESIRIERREGEATVGFRHGLETLWIPDEHREPKSVMRRAAVKLEHLRVLEWVYDAAWPIASWYGEPSRPNLFDPTHGLGFYLVYPPPEIEEAFDRFERLLGAYRRFCEQNGIKLVVALLPQRFQLQERDWRQTVVKYGLKGSSFDVEQPNRRILEFCRANGIDCINPTAAMRDTFRRDGRSLYLPRGDMHWNRYGHRAFHEATSDDVLRHIRRGEDS